MVYSIISQRKYIVAVVILTLFFKSLNVIQYTEHTFAECSFMCFVPTNVIYIKEDDVISVQTLYYLNFSQ